MDFLPSHQLLTLIQAGPAPFCPQFDSVDDAVYKRLRGRARLGMELQVIWACTTEGITVDLTPTLVPGIDIDATGGILRKAPELSPAVRAVHYQPICHFGRYRHIVRYRYPGCHLTPGKGKIRQTLPERHRVSERRSIRRRAFPSAGCEHARCSFNTGRRRHGVSRCLAYRIGKRSRLLHSPDGPGSPPDSVLPL